MIKVSVSGKLFVAGEYAVVNSGSSAILIAVNRFLNIEINPSDTLSVSSQNYFDNTILKRSNNIVVNNNSDNFKYVYYALKIVEEYVLSQNITLENYQINITSDLLSDNNEKLGLGSSGAVTVGIIKAILKFYNLAYDNLLLFKLSALSSSHISINSSFGDIAAIVYTGMIKYTTFDKEFVFNYYKNNGLIKTLELDWPLLNIESINFDLDLALVVGWTKKPSDTLDLVKKIEIDKASDFYKDFVIKSNNIVLNICDAIVNNDVNLFKDMISLNRELLLNLNASIETKELSALIEIVNKSGVSKVSGAGGGDCGIGFVSKDFDINRIIEKLDENNIKYLDLDIYSKGDIYE